ncbi:MAG: hypothetical protein JWR08_653 [Enterovirga sp.]|nr:hypothetical protein [Enterovirga sp.]
MLIVCPSCASEYTIDPDRIGAAGRAVRCAQCRESWFVAGPQPTSVAVTDDRGEPDSPAPQSGRLIDAVPYVPSRRGRGGARHGPAVSRAAGSGRIADRLAIAALSLLLLALPTALAARTALVRAVPETAGIFAAMGLPVNLVGVALEDVTSALTDEAGARLLVIEGTIRSVGGEAAPLPRLDYAIEGEDGTILYRWSSKPPVAEIAPRETLRFSAKLAAPPPAGRRVVVTFRTARDGDAVASR